MKIKDLIKAEKTTLKVIQSESVSCKACKEQAIAHHKAIIEELEILDILLRKCVDILGLVCHTSCKDDYNVKKAGGSKWLYLTKKEYEKIMKYYLKEIYGK